MRSSTTVEVEKLLLLVLEDVICSVLFARSALCFVHGFVRCDRGSRGVEVLNDSEVRVLGPRHEVSDPPQTQTPAGLDSRSKITPPLTSATDK